MSVAIGTTETGSVAEVGDDGRLVRLTGRLDVTTAADVRLLLFEQVQRGDRELVVDLAALAAVDATGLGVLVGAHRHAGRAGRVLVLRDATAQVARLLRVTRLDRVLRQTRTRRSA